MSCTEGWSCEKEARRLPSASPGAVAVFVAQLYPTLCDPTGCISSGFSVHEILQARIPEWVPFSRGSSQPRDRTRVSCIVRRLFTIWATRKARKPRRGLQIKSTLLTPQSWTSRLKKCEKINTYCLSPPVYDILLRQLEQTNTWIQTLDILHKMRTHWRKILCTKFLCSGNFKRKEIFKSLSSLNLSFQMHPMALVCKIKAMFNFSGRLDLLK